MTEDDRANLVAKAIHRAGERKQLAGHGTMPFTATIQMVEPNGDGTFKPTFQRVEFVHVTAGNINTGVKLYRVGFALGRACIVVRADLNPGGRYEVAWEDWPGSLRRAGSPPGDWIEFDD